MFTVILIRFLMYFINVYSLLVVDLCILVKMKHHNQCCSSLWKKYVHIKGPKLNNIDMVFVMYNSRYCS